ncbi:polysaccharide deacetylase family protein [Parapedobacter sp.]
MIGGVLVILVIIGIAIIAWGAFRIQANFFLKAIHKGNAEGQRIALTFDDGPHPVYTPRVLELLSRHNAKATFFCIGKNVIKHPDIVKQIHDAGHTVGNHSFSHAPTIDFHGKRGWLGELQQTDTAIELAIHRRPRFFRPPYGVTTPHLANAIHISGHRVIGWRVRPYDTLKRRSPVRIVRTILRNMAPGDIILLHDTHDRIVPVLEQLLPQLRQRGYPLVTVAQLIDQDAYAQT